MTSLRQIEANHYNALRSTRSARQKTIKTAGAGAKSFDAKHSGLSSISSDATDRFSARDRDQLLRLANLDSDIVDRLSRYESGLWRQLVQTIFALQTLKRRSVR
jgi:hypothetical protein